MTNRGRAALLFLAALAAVSLLGCGRSRSPEALLRQEMRVADLGAQCDVRGTRVSFRLPVGWQELPAETVAEASAQSMGLQDSRLADGYRVVPLQIYSLAAGDCVCIVSKLEPSGPEVPTQVRVGVFLDRVRTAFKEATIVEGTFRLGGLVVHQLRMTTPAYIHFKLLVTDRGADPVQIDYLVPPSAYGAEAHKVLSSVASISRSGSAP